MKFDLDPRALASFITRLQGIEPTSVPPTTKRSGRPYDGPKPVAEFRLEDLHDFREYETDKYGRRSAVHCTLPSGPVRIADEAWIDLKRIAADIVKRCQLADAVSADFVEDVCADYVFDFRAGKEVEFIPNLGVRVKEAVQTCIFDFPISGLMGTVAFSFGGVDFLPWSPLFKKVAEAMSPVETEDEQRRSAYSTMLATYQKDYGRSMWASVTLVAEMTHGERIARARILNATNLLRALCVQGYQASRFISLHPGEPLSLGEFYVSEHGSTLSFHDGGGLGHDPVVLSANGVKELYAVGLGNLDNLFKRENKTEMNELCLRAIGALGKAVAMPDISDKILYACTALDLVFVRSKEEPILATMPRRFAVYMGNDLEERKAIELNIKKIYGQRSGRIHAAEDAELEESIFDFLRSAYMFAGRLSFLADEFQTKKAFLDNLDERMLS